MTTQTLLNGIEVILVSNNSEFLKEGKVSEPYLDLNILYTFDVCGLYDHIAFPLEKIFNESGITRSELFSRALENVKRKGFVVSNLFDTIKELGDDIYDHCENELPTIKLVTNQHKRFGATALLFPEIFKDISDELTSSLYILPSSIHELIVIPRNEYDDWCGLVEMIKTVNETEVDPKDRLSDTLYWYDRNTGCIDIWREDGQVEKM